MLLSILVVALRISAWGAEVLPPAPRDHFNDYAGAVTRETAQRLNGQLDQFERETSNQILVAIYPTMQSNSSIEDYTVRVAQSWGVGLKDRKNGAVLFIFKNDRTLFIQVGYGLEGPLPDARCKQIIENEIVPRFKAGDFDGGVTAGVAAILASVRGEYTGTGSTVNDQRGGAEQHGGGWIFGVIIALIVIQAIFGRRRNTLYTRGGRRGIWMFPGGGSGWGGGNWGGGSSGGGGGTFSGGGGSFGGGGAGGRW